MTREHHERGGLFLRKRPDSSKPQKASAVPIALRSGRDRNTPCPCGSGKKWKRCHNGAREPERKIDTDLLDKLIERMEDAPITQPVRFMKGDGTSMTLEYFEACARRLGTPAAQLPRTVNMADAPQCTGCAATFVVLRWVGFDGLNATCAICRSDRTRELYDHLRAMESHSTPVERRT